MVKGQKKFQGRLVLTSVSLWKIKKKKAAVKMSVKGL